MWTRLRRKPRFCRCNGSERSFTHDRCILTGLCTMVYIIISALFGLEVRYVCGGMYVRFNWARGWPVKSAREKFFLLFPGFELGSCADRLITTPRPLSLWVLLAMQVVRFSIGFHQRKFEKFWTQLMHAPHWLMHISDRRAPDSKEWQMTVL